MTSVTRTSAASVLIAALLASSVAAAVYQQHANAEDAPREQIAEQMAKEAGSHTMVRVAAGAFDPLDGVPAVPASLRAPAGSRYALVQVEYPSTAAVQDAMRAAGAELLGVLPDVTYVVRADAADLDRVRDIEGVRWVGPYHPAYKLAPGVEKVEPGRRLRAWPHAGIDGTTFAAALRAVPGVSAVTATKRVTSFEAPASALAAVARIDDVQWVEVAPRYELHNRNALWVTDTGERDKLAATAPGRLDGTGQTAAVADTGVNYIPDDNARAQAAFSDCNAAGQCKLADYVQATPGDLPAELATVRSTGQRHRKMAGYFNLTDDTKARSQEGSWHGTHVSGSVAADYPDANGGYGTRNREADGIAVGARLVFQDVESEGGLGGLPESPYDLFNQVYDLNKNGQYDPLEDARTHNNSYGAIYPEVDAGGATDADAFIRDHPDMTVVFSAANSGPDAASLAGGPQVSKNTITSCASANGRQPMVSPDSAASFSSHGPTLDGRVKPDVCTPGQINVSPKGGTVNEDHYLQGTSMSGPMLVGLVTLVRQYFWDGYGPAGTAGFARGARSLSRRHNPSAALVKAVTINSAQRMRGVYTGDDGTDRAQDGQWPSSGQGWGKVELDKSLYFEGDDRGLYAVDVPNDTTNGFATGQQVTHFVDVAPGQPLDISLTWTDPASALGAGTPTLVNDLDLTVTAPNGTTTYLGNEFTTQSPTLGPGGSASAEVGESKTGGTKDSTNNVEGVRVAAPAPGRYQVTVRAANVAQGRQGYALAVSGRLATDTTRIVFDAPKYKPGAKATAYLLGTTLSGDTVDGFTRLGPSVYRREITASGPSVVAEAAGARATAPVDSTSPVASGAQVESVSADLARVTWTSDEPSSAELVVSGGGAETTFPDAYNPSSFPGLETPVLENKGVYLNRKVVSPQHEVNVTGLKPGTTYTYTVRSTDEAGNTGDGPTGTFTSTEGMYAPKANDMAMLLSGETTAGLPTTDLPAVGGQGWGTSTQLYAGYLEPLPTQLEPGLGGTPTGRVEAIPAFMFRLPGSIDPKRITGAAVEMFSAHDIHDTYTAETTYSLDLLDSSAESGWGPGKTFASVKGAAADVQMAPDPTLRRGANVKYAWQVPCNELTKFQENLSEDGTTEKRAAFRLQGLSEANESLFSFEAGFNRRSRGPQLRPRLVLFLDGLDPQPCTASAAPEISNVLVDHTDTTSAVVSWQTDVPSDSTVYYRKVGEAAWTPVSAPVRVTQHFVRVAGLTNNGTYEFVVRSATCNGLASVDDNGGKSYAMYNAAFVPPKLNGIHSVPSTATANTQIVSWTTDQEADTIVRYGTSPTALNTEIKQTTRSGEHTVSLPNLVACTRYYFTVTSTNSAGKAATSEVLAFDRAPTNLPTTVASYDFESGEQGWTNDPAAGTGNTGTPVGVGVATGKTLWQRRTAETGSQAMRTIVKETGAPGYTSNADQRLVSPAITVPSTGHTAVEWTEWHNFEGVADIEAYDNPTVQVTMPDGTVYTLRSAVTSQNPDFPDATTVRIGLPHETAGQTVRVTFRLKSDAAVETPGGGWAVDNVKVLNGSCATLAGVVAGVPLAPTAPPPNLTTTAQSVTVGPVPPVAASGAAIGELPTLVGAPSAASVAAGTCRCGDVRYLGQAVAATGGGTGGGPAPSVAAGAPTGTLPATGGSPGLFGLVALALLWAAMALRRRLSG